MILLEKPYISEFLLQTLEKGRIPVVQTPLAEEIAIGRNLNLLHESEVISKYNGSGDPLLYTNSENSISWIENNLQHTQLPGKIKLFKIRPISGIC